MTKSSIKSQRLTRSFGLCLFFTFGAVASGACLVDAQLSTGSSDSKETGGKGSEQTEPGSTDPGSTDQGSGGGAEPGEEEQVQCDTIDGGTCLAEIPFGWSGPIQPQRAKSVDGLAPCKKVVNMFSGRASESGSGPDAAKNVFVDSVEAAPATCSNQGCGVELDTGGCTPMAFVIRRLESESPRKCGEALSDFPPPFLGPTCKQLDPSTLTEPDHAVGAIPAQPLLSEASCTATGESSAEIPEPIFDDYYRICAGESEEVGTCPTGQECTSFRNRENLGRMSMGCVYQKGDVACPAGPYKDIRLVLFGEARDERGCTGCQVSHQKGTLSCEYGMRLAKNDEAQTCEGSESVKAEDICITKSELLGPEGPYSALGEYLRVEYSGKCEPRPSEPSGELRLAEPVTLCCSEF